MTNPLLQLQKLGQSVWYDNIDRGQLASGQFKRLLDEDGVLVCGQQRHEPTEGVAVA